MKKNLIAAVATFLTLSGTALAGNSLLPETATEALALKLGNEVQQGGYKLLSVAGNSAIPTSIVCRAAFRPGWMPAIPTRPI